MSEFSEPVLVGLLFADRIIEEKNGKKGIIGTFTCFNAPTFPAVFPPWFIYAAVTHIQGKHAFSLNLVHVATMQVLCAISGECFAKELTDTLEITPPNVGIVFPREGKYTLTFNIDGAQVGSRILQVNTIPQSEGQQ